MKKWLGIGLIVLAVLIVFAGWATWSGTGEEGTALEGARVVSAEEFADAKEGELVALEATTVQQGTSPVTGSPAAWYRVTRMHHWRERRSRCKLDLPCRREWGRRKEPYDTLYAPALQVKLDDSDTTLTLQVPETDDAVARIPAGEKKREPLDIEPTDTHTDHYQVSREYLLPPDKTVTVVGTVAGSGDERTLNPEEGLALVYNAPRDEMLDDLRGYERVGLVMVLVGLLMAAGGVYLIRRHRREAANPSPTSGPRVLSTKLPEGTVLGGVDRPMEIEVPCPACKANIRFEYHDVQSRWHAATAKPFTKPGWQRFNAERPVAADETALDMACPNCARPMRVIAHGEEWRMSLWMFRVVEILVLSSAAD